jgi:endonuclease/exonuclease/phosphatase family metal-dependent hydrolase
VTALEPDVVALQEVTRRTLPRWRDALAAAGLAHATCPLDGGPPAAGRRLAVLTASRAVASARPAPAGLPWPERVLVTGLAEPIALEIVNVHSPISPAPALAKVRTHEALHAALAEPGATPRVLCGDLNVPRREHPDGSVLTFAHTSSGRLRPERGERWAAAERALVTGLRDHGYVDAFRALHGFDAREASWTFPGGKGGWRLDHVLVRGLRPVAAAYAHAWREAGLSDHSALVVELATLE